MKTIEERAKEYATKILGGKYVSGFKGEVWLSHYVEYVEVAKEQREIDIEKACHTFCRFCHHQCEGHPHDDCQLLIEYKQAILEGL